ncbi:MAG: DUF4136 domain-containing protein [Opitutales bacterium]|jgi:hypothetical protein|nr:DUF4136 domain-containing protein [Opitutales bacterium]
MKMLIRNSLLFLAPLFLAFGCNTTSTIQSVARDGEDFSQFSTYAFINKNRARTVPGVNPAELMWIPPIVKEKLQALGYREVPEAEADMFISIETEVTGGREKGGFSIGIGGGSYSRSGGSSVGVSSGPIGAGYIEQSTLSIRVTEPEKEELLWVGWIDKLENDKFNQQEFTSKVREIMDQFPAQ